GGTALSAWLPEGDTWYDYWTDQSIAGNDSRDHTFTPRTGELPIFVRAGAILPRYAFAKSVREMDKSVLELDVYVGHDGAFDLVEEDGVSENSRIGDESPTTCVRSSDAVRGLVIDHPREKSSAGAPAARAYVVRFHGLKSPILLRAN